MPLTVITLKKAPASLRGDLSKWMQETATGVYVGNFNVRIREQLWQRVQESIGEGEASITYASRNELGYSFETIHSNRQVLDYEGIPLVLIKEKKDIEEGKNLGFSNASKYRNAKRFKVKSPSNEKSSTLPVFVVLDIETTGLDENRSQITEIAALKIDGQNEEEFHSLIKIDGRVPTNISNLTNITKDLLEKKGKTLSEVLPKLLDFIKDYPIVGYGINFDIRFLNKSLQNLNLKTISNPTIDLLRLVKKEKILLPNYKLSTVLSAYGINENVSHRAMADVRLIQELSFKVNEFQTLLNNKSLR